MIWISAVLCFLLILQFGVLWFLLRNNWKNHSIRLENDLPLVSVLVAVRNEEKDLPRLLKSLSALDYPQEKLEILVADDQSTDQTNDLIRTWVNEIPFKKIVSILPEQTHLFHRNGKANALAILAKQASGDFFFFTDADCEVPCSWIRAGVGCFKEGVGIVIGMTHVRGQGLFEQLQAVDWWNTLGIVKVVTDLNFATTGLGNNMAISQKAYKQSGGFEGVPFSLTEDLEISRAVRNAGFLLIQEVSPQILVGTKAEASWNDLFRQRKRWMNGVMSLSKGWKILLSLQFLFFPFLFYLLTQIPILGMAIWIAKILVQSLFLSAIASKAGQRLMLLPLVLFDFYQFLTLSLSILYYFWPSQTQWKSRTYP